MVLLRFRAFYVALLIGSLLLVGSCTRAIAFPGITPGAKVVLPVFEDVVGQLSGQTKVPIVLPTYIPTDALVPFSEAEGGPQPYLNVPVGPDGQFEGIYVYVTGASSDHYDLSLDVTADCNGAGFCSFGILMAQRVYQGTPSVASEYAFELEPDFRPIMRSPEEQGEVQLAQGITGYFVPYVCGANCDTAKVFWKQQGYQYSVGIRMASKAAVVQMANSAINNEP